MKQLHPNIGEHHWSIPMPGSITTLLRMAVRLGSSLLGKVVDCLAPSLSSILVKDKEVIHF